MKLGAGSFGRVRPAADKRTGRLTMAEFVRKRGVLNGCIRDEHRQKDVPTEVHVLMHVRHEHIVNVCPSHALQYTVCMTYS